jgi:hypothetical protein
MDSADFKELMTNVSNVFKETGKATLPIIDALLGVDASTATWNDRIKAMGESLNLTANAVRSVTEVIAPFVKALSYIVSALNPQNVLNNKYLAPFMGGAIPTRTESPVTTNNPKDDNEDFWRSFIGGSRSSPRVVAPAIPEVKAPVVSPARIKELIESKPKHEDSHSTPKVSTHKVVTNHVTINATHTKASETHKLVKQYTNYGLE